MARSLALLALAGAAAAASTTVSVFLPTFDEQDLDASVIAADSEKTTYLINCPAGTDSNDCGVATGGQTIVYGPKTFALSYGYEGGDMGAYEEDIGCKLDPSKDYASCSVYVSQSYDGTTTSSSTAVGTTGYLSLIIPVTVTAGANKLSADSDDSDETATTLSTVAAPASTAGSSEATATESGSSADSTSAAKSGSSASGSAASATGSSADATSTPTATDNAAGPMVTQNAVLVGAAALLGGAAMLL